jgi:hypothetical protein
MPNFLTISLEYLDWEKKIIFSLYVIYVPIKKFNLLTILISNLDIISLANSWESESQVAPNTMSSIKSEQ